MANRYKMAVIVWLTGCMLHSAGAATIYVATNGVNTRTGLNYWTNAVATIAQGVTLATTDGDTVLVSNGTYVLSATITVANNITIQGYTNNGLVIVDGNNAVQCFSMTKGLLNGLFITRGKVAGSGGGAILYGAASAGNCVFSNNSASVYGGGLESSTGTNNYIRDCTFVANGALIGGAGVILINSTTEVSRCVFITNSAAYGGALESTYSAKSIVSNCDFMGNIATNSGGAIYLGTLGGLITHSRFSSNLVLSADLTGGGVIYMGDSAGIVSNCFMSNNVSVKYGGAIYLAGSNNYIAGCTVSKNIASATSGNGGGGVYCKLTTVTLTAPNYLRNCVFNGNISSNHGGAIFSWGGLVVQNSLIVSNVARNAGYGGGIYSRYNTRVENCTIVSN
jgi:predicted outer membrane repeat protein